jgi:integrase
VQTLPQFGELSRRHRRQLPNGSGCLARKHNPALALKCLRITKKDRPPIDPFTIQEAEALIAAIHREWGEAQGNYDEFRFFTGLRPSEQIALRVMSAVTSSSGSPARSLIQ